MNCFTKMNGSKRNVFIETFSHQKLENDIEHSVIGKISWMFEFT